MSKCLCTELSQKFTETCRNAIYFSADTYSADNYMLEDFFRHSVLSVFLEDPADFLLYRFLHFLRCLERFSEKSVGRHSALVL